jgi:hypothetical protein
VTFSQPTPVSNPVKKTHPETQDQPRGHSAHAYAQCRSNKGAPDVDGQDFADIEEVQRWLGEMLVTCIATLVIEAEQ